MTTSTHLTVAKVIPMTDKLMEAKDHLSNKPSYPNALEVQRVSKKREVLIRQLHASFHDINATITE